MVLLFVISSGVAQSGVTLEQWWDPGCNGASTAFDAGTAGTCMSKIIVLCSPDNTQATAQWFDYDGCPGTPGRTKPMMVSGVCTPDGAMGL